MPQRWSKDRRTGDPKGTAGAGCCRVIASQPIPWRVKGPQVWECLLGQRRDEECGAHIQNKQREAISLCSCPDLHPEGVQKEEWQDAGPR